MREDEARPLVENGQLSIWTKVWLTMPLNLAWTAENNDNPYILKVREVISYLWKPATTKGLGNTNFNY